MASSLVSSLIAKHNLQPLPDDNSKPSNAKIKSSTGGAAAAAQGDAGGTRVCLTIYIFRGEPDTWNKRHVVAYFTSPDLPDFHETVHAQAYAETGEWNVFRLHHAIRWIEQRTYLDHVNAGAFLVTPGDEMVAADILAGVPVRGRTAEWNCQHFVWEGLQELVKRGMQTQEWYDLVEGEMMDKILATNVG